MELADVISLSISIGMGILSIGLGIFSIWLSHRFAEQSSQVLSNLKETAIEIRTLTAGVLTNQDHFSSKMLDSIINKNSYGVDTDLIQTESQKLFESRLQEIELKINVQIEDTVNKFIKTSANDTSELRTVIESIKGDINSLVNTAKIATNPTEIPHRLKKIMKDWIDFPALIILIELIIENYVKTEDGVRQYAPKYNLPNGWEGGVDGLIESGVLRGTREAFSVEAEYMVPLNMWLSMNKTQIENIKNLYEYDGSSTSPLEEARKISATIAF